MMFYKSLPNKIIVILGPTASGKSDLAVRLAKKFEAEVVSADSRQVYRGLNIGTGKITKKEMRGVKHHLLDVADPIKQFTVVDFKEKATRVIEEIRSRGHLPIICGGTGFYIQAVTDNLSIPDVPPNGDLRKKLAQKSTEELFRILKKLDPKRAENIDPKNPRRLIRAIEIATTLGRVPKRSLPKTKDDLLFIGVKTELKVLRQNINQRLRKRITQGMIAEAKKLHTKGLPWQRMEKLGLEYKYLALYLQNKITKKEFEEKLESEIWRYAKRQMTWFKKNKRVKWFYKKDTIKIERLVRIFLKTSSPH